jgi:hypothetical protein
MPSSKSLRMGHHFIGPKIAIIRNLINPTVRYLLVLELKIAGVPDAKHFATEIFKICLIKLN